MTFGSKWFFFSFSIFFRTGFVFISLIFNQNVTCSMVFTRSVHTIHNISKRFGWKETGFYFLNISWAWGIHFLWLFFRIWFCAKSSNAICNWWKMSKHFVHVSCMMFTYKNDWLNPFSWESGAFNNIISILNGFFLVVLL